MGLFDSLLKKAKDAVDAKTEEFIKKVESVHLDAPPKTPQKRTSTKKPAKKPKRCLSIEIISQQILAQRDNLIKNGYKEYEFISNKGCCPICKKLNGKHFLVSELTIGVNAPPMHEGCTCSIAAYSDDKSYEKWLKSL